EHDTPGPGITSMARSPLTTDCHMRAMTSRHEDRTVRRVQVARPATSAAGVTVLPHDRVATRVDHDNPVVTGVTDQHIAAGHYHRERRQAERRRSTCRCVAPQHPPCGRELLNRARAS